MLFRAMATKLFGVLWQRSLAAKRRTRASKTRRCGEFLWEGAPGSTLRGDMVTNAALDSEQEGILRSRRYMVVHLTLMCHVQDD